MVWVLKKLGECLRNLDMIKVNSKHTNYNTEATKINTFVPLKLEGETTKQIKATK